MCPEKKKVPMIIASPLPRWIRRAFKLKDEAKREKIFMEARNQGFSLADLLFGFEEFKMKRDAKEVPAN